MTDSAVILVGQNAFNGSAANVETRAPLVGVFTIAAGKALALQYWVASSGGGASGLGGAQGITSTIEVYAEVLLRKIA